MLKPAVAGAWVCIAKIALQTMSARWPGGWGGKFSIIRSWVQNLSLSDERSNRETSRRIGFYSVYSVTLNAFLRLLLIVIISLKAVTRAHHEEVDNMSPSLP